ncbi:MAG: vWA domain-containing protein, partial [Phycisphaerales bacterium]
MTLIDPTSGLIAAAIAGPIFFTLYLLRLRRRPLRVTSTLLWEQAVKDLQVNVPFRWLRPSLIMFLQLAALTAFILALARPALPGDGPIADRIIIVIDHTASMSALDAEPASSGPDQAPVTRLDQAKDAAARLVRSLGRSSGRTGTGPEVQVVSAAAQARIRCAFTTDLREVEDQIRAIEPTDQPGADELGGVGAAIDLLQALAAAEGESRAPPEVVVYSDAPLPPGAPSLRARLILPRLRTTAQGTGNVGIVTLNARRDSADPDTIRLFARVQNADTSPRSVSLRLLINGRLAQVHRLELPAAPGDASLSLSANSAEACTLVLTIDQIDPLASDNSAAVHLEAAATPAVLIVAPTTDAGPQPDPFLAGAIESVRPRRVRIVAPADFESELRTARDEARRPWRGFDLVVFDRVEPRDVPPQPSLSFGAGLPLDGLRLAPAAAAPNTPAEPCTTRFNTWRRNDPILRYVALDPILVAPCPPAIRTDSGVQPALRPSAVALAFGRTDSAADAPIIAALPRFAAPPDTRGHTDLHRVVVSFPLARSNWGPHHSFPVFIANAVDHLTGLSTAALGQAWTTDQP